MFDKLLGGSSNSQLRREDDYVDLSDVSPQLGTSTAETTIHFCEINGQQDTINVKDAIYEGDVVVVDLKYVQSAGMSVDHIITELRVVAEEVGGDIAQRGDNQLLITPGGVDISRQKL